MRLITVIELYPSFHEMHSWSVELSDDHCEVAGKCLDTMSTWRLSKQELAALPAEVRSGWFPDSDYDRIGFDGITVSFSITTDVINRQKEIWCPEQSVCPEYASLLRWCWDGLYEHSPKEYRVRLEQLYSYFSDWGASIRRTSRGLRIFGGLSTLDEQELRRYFDEVAELSMPEIDMSNFEGTGTLLYPIFKQFAERSPNSKWRVNASAQFHMKQAGIPETSMLLVEVDEDSI